VQKKVLHTPIFAYSFRIQKVNSCAKISVNFYISGILDWNSFRERRIEIQVIAEVFGE